MSNTLIAIHVKNVRPNMISGDCLITSVEYVGDKVRIWYSRGRYEDYSLDSWISVSKYDNAMNKINEKI